MSQQLPHDFVPWNTEELPVKPVKRKLKPGVTSAITFLLVIAVLVAFLFGWLFRIRHVTVHIERPYESSVLINGKAHYTAEDIVELAGLQGGVSYFAVNDQWLEKRIEKKYDLDYVGMVKTFPQKLEVTVIERQARANVQVMGVTYFLDENGMVLETSAMGLNPDLPIVTGLQSRSVMEGKFLVSGNEDQMEAYQAIMQELLAQGYLGKIAELKVSDPESLYLLTRDGYTVHLGNSEELRAKIGTVRAVEMKLMEMGERDGVIDASVPAVATYTPSEI